MKGDAIWSAGFSIFLILCGIGMLVDNSYDNQRAMECEQRGNEWRVMESKDDFSPKKMGCVVVKKEKA